MHTLKIETRQNMSRKPKEVAHPELLRGEWALNCKDDSKYNAKDEYYTQYENVRQVFEEYIDTSVLKGKVIWLPCDTEESWFYKWLVQHKDEYGYEELIMTSDDMFTHDDILMRADFVIDNVPFSRACEILDMFADANRLGHDIRFFIFYNLNSMSSILAHCATFDNVTVHRPKCGAGGHFDTPNDQPVFYMSSLCYVTDMKLSDKLPRRKFSSKMKKCSDYDEFVYGVRKNGEKLPVFDFLRDIPIDIEGWFLCPVTCALHDYDEWLEIDYSKIREYPTYTDGLSRYIRFDARWIKRFE